MGGHPRVPRIAGGPSRVLLCLVSLGVVATVVPGGSSPAVASKVAPRAADPARVHPEPQQQPQRFVCTAMPVEMDNIPCAAPTSWMASNIGTFSPPSSSSSSSSSLSSSSSSAIGSHLREIVRQHKETISRQREAIKELTTKLSRCESGGHRGSAGLRKGQPQPQQQQQEEEATGLAGSRHAELEGAAGMRNTMGDPPRDSTEMLEELGKTTQALKDRLEHLETHAAPGRTDWATAARDAVRELLESRALELTGNRTAHARIDKALGELRHRIAGIEKGVDVDAAAPPAPPAPPPDAFKVSFPLRTDYMVARAAASLPEMHAFSASLWLRSSASGGVGTPLSYAVPRQSNEIVLMEWGHNPVELLVNDKMAQLPLSLNDGRWHHVVVTWTSRDGVWEAFQDGALRGTGDALAPWHPITPGGVLVLGQEQDKMGGRFDAMQAFVGELADLQMWNRVLSASEVASLAGCSSGLRGNVLAWSHESIEVQGGATKWPLETCGERINS